MEPHDEINVLMGESFPPHEGTKKAVYKPGSRPSPNTRSVGVLIWDYTTSRTMRNKCVLFKPPCLWQIVIAAQTD